MTTRKLAPKKSIKQPKRKQCLTITIQEVGNGWIVSSNNESFEREETMVFFPLAGARGHVQTLLSKLKQNP
jgi:hypothetical protein